MHEQQLDQAQNQYNFYSPQKTPAEQIQTPNEQYTTHINELLSEPACQSMHVVATKYILSSLYELSSYLFTKKMSHQQNPQMEMSFEGYLDHVQRQYQQYDKHKKYKQIQFKNQVFNVQSELIKCYQKVDSIYFEDRYFLNFSIFEDIYEQLKIKDENTNSKVNQQLDKLCQNLDLVEINLFTQIHNKFHEYFTVVANFDYLSQTIRIQLLKLKESRGRIHRVRECYVDKSSRLRKKIIQRQNIEKVLKNIKIIRSLKKLPNVIESILASSLPYESLDLLKDTKSKLSDVKDLKCLKNTSENIRSMQVLAKSDLNKRYSNELYTYLEQCFTSQRVTLVQLWKRIQIRAILDKDSSMVMNELQNNTSSSFISERSGMNLLDQLETLDGINEKIAFNNQRIKRNQGKEYEIAMILIQSYEYIDFNADVTNIKICISLRNFVKRFQKQLASHLAKAYQEQIQYRTHHKPILGVLDSINETQQQQQQQQQAKKSPKSPKSPRSPKQTKQHKEQQQTPQLTSFLVDKISVQFYVKHIQVLNDIFKEVINRFLGYMLTVVGEYQEEVVKNLEKIVNFKSNSKIDKMMVDEQEQNKSKIILKLKETHKKFKQLFTQQCSLLPLIFKVIFQKLNHFLTLKNISNIGYVQFYKWISTFKFWQKYFNYIAENHPLFNCGFMTINNFENEQIKEFGLQLMKEVQNIYVRILQQVNKQIKLKGMMDDLSKNYINAYHQNILNNEVINGLQEETWQSVEIPTQFSEILSSIINGQQKHNISITILNSSTDSQPLNTSQSSHNSDLNKSTESTVRRGLKFKILKNNILTGGIRYKVNLSFMLLCEYIDQYLKMSRLLKNILGDEEDKPNRVVFYVYQKLYQMIERYSSYTKELILQTKALKFEKIKAKSINAKHICLLCNCLSLTIKIVQQLLNQKKLTLYNFHQTHQSLLKNISQIHTQLLHKLSTIISTKIQYHIKMWNQSKTNYQQTNNSIVSTFLQMVQITDQYLDIDSIRKILRNAFQIFIQKYVNTVIKKGIKNKDEIEMLVEKIKFMKKYFGSEFQGIAKELNN